MIKVALNIDFTGYPANIFPYAGSFQPLKPDIWPNTPDIRPKPDYDKCRIYGATLIIDL